MNTEVQDPNNPQKKMGITLEVSTESFEKLIKDQLDLLTDEDKKAILKECLLESIKQLIDKSQIDLISKPEYGYGNRLTSFGERLVEQIDVTNQLTELKNKIMNDLVEHHRDLAVEAIIRSLQNQIINNNSFYEAIRNTVRQVISDMRENR